MPFDVYKLTIKQEAFADYYIKLGNVMDAYLKIYSNVKKEETAGVAGS
jgi:phage terminase small subunit